MRVRVGHISAHCGSCGGEDFHPGLGQSAPLDELVCLGCGTHTTRVALLTQIADETVRQAKTFLERSRQSRKRSREP